eukprot:g76399.t1
MWELHEAEEGWELHEAEEGWELHEAEEGVMMYEAKQDTSEDTQPKRAVKAVKKKKRVKKKKVLVAGTGDQEVDWDTIRMQEERMKREEEALARQLASLEAESQLSKHQMAKILLSPEIAPQKARIMQEEEALRSIQQEQVLLEQLQSQLEQGSPEALPKLKAAAQAAAQAGSHTNHKPSASKRTAAAHQRKLNSNKASVGSGKQEEEEKTQRLNVEELEAERLRRELMELDAMQRMLEDEERALAGATDETLDLLAEEQDTDETKPPPRMSPLQTSFSSSSSSLHTSFSKSKKPIREIDRLRMEMERDLADLADKAAVHTQDKQQQQDAAAWAQQGPHTEAEKSKAKLWKEREEQHLRQVQTQKVLKPQPLHKVKRTVPAPLNPTAGRTNTSLQKLQSPALPASEDEELGDNNEASRVKPVGIKAGTVQQRATQWASEKENGPSSTAPTTHSLKPVVPAARGKTQNGVASEPVQPVQSSLKPIRLQQLKTAASNATSSATAGTKQLGFKASQEAIKISLMDQTACRKVKSPSDSSEVGQRFPANPSQKMLVLEKNEVQSKKKIIYSHAQEQEEHNLAALRESEEAIGQVEQEEAELLAQEKWLQQEEERQLQQQQQLQQLRAKQEQEQEQRAKQEEERRARQEGERRAREEQERARQRQEQEEARQRQEEERERARQRQEEERAKQAKQEEDREKRARQEEERARQRQEEERARQRQEEERARQRQEEERARQRQEEERARQRQEEERARQRQGKERARQRQEEERAARAARQREEQQRRQKEEQQRIQQEEATRRAAAVLIQAVWRGKMARRARQQEQLRKEQEEKQRRELLQQEKEQLKAQLLLLLTQQEQDAKRAKAAVSLQAAWRGRRGRRLASKARKEKQDKENMQRELRRAQMRQEVLRTQEILKQQQQQLLQQQQLIQQQQQQLLQQQQQQQQQQLLRKEIKLKALAQQHDNMVDTTLAIGLESVTGNAITVQAGGQPLHGAGLQVSPGAPNESVQIHLSPIRPMALAAQLNQAALASAKSSAKNHNAPAVPASGPPGKHKRADSLRITRPAAVAQEAVVGEQAGEEDNQGGSIRKKNMPGHHRVGSKITFRGKPVLVQQHGVEANGHKQSAEGEVEGVADFAAAGEPGEGEGQGEGEVEGEEDVEATLEQEVAARTTRLDDSSDRQQQAPEVQLMSERQSMWIARQDSRPPSPQSPFLPPHSGRQNSEMPPESPDMSSPPPAPPSTGGSNKRMLSRTGSQPEGEYGEPNEDYLQKKRPLGAHNRVNRSISAPSPPAPPTSSEERTGSRRSANRRGRSSSGRKGQSARSRVSPHQRNMEPASTYRSASRGRSKSPMTRDAAVPSRQQQEDAKLTEYVQESLRKWVAKAQRFHDKQPSHIVQLHFSVQSVLPIRSSPAARPCIVVMLRSSPSEQFQPYGQTETLREFASWGNSTFWEQNVRYDYRGPHDQREFLIQVVSLADPQQAAVLATCVTKAKQLAAFTNVDKIPKAQFAKRRVLDLPDSHRKINADGTRPLMTVKVQLFDRRAENKEALEKAIEKKKSDLFAKYGRGFLRQRSHRFRCVISASCLRSLLQCAGSIQAAFAMISAQPSLVLTSIDQLRTSKPIRRATQ